MYTACPEDSVEELSGRNTRIHSLFPRSAEAPAVCIGVHMVAAAVQEARAKRILDVLPRATGRPPRSPCRSRSQYFSELFATHAPPHVAGVRWRSSKASTTGRSPLRRCRESTCSPVLSARLLRSYNRVVPPRGARRGGGTERW